MIKPLYETERRPVATRTARTPTSQQGSIVPHSSAQARRAEHYHAKIIGQDPRLVDELNPTRTLRASRSFPGLANGE